MNEENQHIDQQFEDQVRHAITLAERDNIRDFISSLEQNYADEQMPPKAVVRPMFNKRFFLVAASLLLMAAAIMTFRSMKGQSPTQIADAYFVPHPNSHLPVVRSNDEVITAEQWAVHRYEAEDWPEAFKQLSALEDQNEHIRIFIGVSAYFNDDIAAAKNEFQAVLNMKAEEYRTAQWYLGLIELKEGNVEKAKIYLQELASQPADSSHQRDAVKVLDELG